LGKKNNKINVEAETTAIWGALAIAIRPSPLPKKQ